MNNIELATTVVLVGLSIVFIALIGLTVIFMLYGKIVSSLEAKKKDSPKPVIADAPSVPTKPASIAIEQGIDDEVVAAISAAIACMLGDDAGFTIRSVKRAPRKPWQMAGMMQNTRSY